MSAQPSAECTGIAAVWCPNCGDCTCPKGADDMPQKGADPRCPLHGDGAAHAEGPEAADGADATAAELDALRALLGEVQARLERDAVAFGLRGAIDRLGAAAAKACADTCRSRATIIRFAREHVEAGHHDRALALLRGDIPGPARG